MSNFNPLHIFIKGYASELLLTTKYFFYHSNIFLQCGIKHDRIILRDRGSNFKLKYRAFISNLP